MNRLTHFPPFPPCLLPSLHFPPSSLGSFACSATCIVNRNQDPSEAVCVGLSGVRLNV